jgi:hypothetical protein
MLCFLQLYYYAAILVSNRAFFKLALYISLYLNSGS